MKHYEKPSLSLALFSSREAIASNPYTSHGTTNENVTIDNVTVSVPVTVYEINSLSSAS